MNIDYKIFNKNENDKYNYEKTFSKRIKSIQNHLLGNSFTQIINEDTRQSKIIDHIYVNNLNKIFKSYIEIDFESDHKFITVEKKMKVIEQEPKFFLTRDHNKINYDLINYNIMNSDKYCYMLSDDNVDRISVNLINMIQNEFNLQAPVLKVKALSDDKLVLNKDTKEFIKKKNDSYKEMKINPSIENIKNYKIISKICRKKIISNKRSNTFKAINNIKNPAKLWKATKKELYGTKTNSIERIIENNKFINGSQKVANMINIYFVKKPNVIANTIPNVNTDPMNFYKSNVEQLINKFRFKQINMSDLRKAISKINLSNSEDYYGISMKMLIKICKSIEPVMLNLINQCIYDSKFPEYLKINKIIPIPKDNNYLEPSNYRSINIFSPISKIIEKCLCIQIDQYLLDNNFLKPNHQGGIKTEGLLHLH